jgi:hypothetical protein
MNDIALAGTATSGLRAMPRSGGGALAGSTAIFVLGMHRSGTSALTGLLHRLGVALGEHLMPASEDNPRGYWENADIVAVHERLMGSLGWTWDDIRSLPAGFARNEPAREAARDLLALANRDFAGTALWGLKDPRLCRLMPLWSPLLAAEAVTPRYVLAVRHPLDVTASLAARDGIGTARGLLLWLGHLLDAERATRGARRVIVHYEELIGARGWRDIADEIARALDIAWPHVDAAAVDAFLAPELRRRRASDEASGGLPGWISAVYDAFRARGPRLGTICDRIGRELAAAGELFVPMLGEALHALGELRSEKQAQDCAVVELAQHLNRVQHEAGELRGQLQRVLTETATAKQQ